MKHPFECPLGVLDAPQWTHTRVCWCVFIPPVEQQSQHTMAYAAELIATARQIASTGKGILAADESTGTIGKRFAQISVENVQDNRRAYRELLFRTDGMGQLCTFLRSRCHFAAHKCMHTASNLPPPSPVLLLLASFSLPAAQVRCALIAHNTVSADARVPLLSPQPLAPPLV